MGRRTEAIAKAAKVEKLLTDLEQQLAFFANGTLEDQRTFKRWLVGWRVGRALSLLMALWYEDNVRSWLFFNSIREGQE